MADPCVALDLRLADRPGAERTGVGRYSLELARSLAMVRPGWRLLGLSNRFDLPETIEPVRTRVPTGSSGGRIAWHEAASAFDRRVRRADLWFGTGYVIPRWWRGPAVVTVHDLTFLLERERYRGRANAAWATSAVRSATRRARVVLCGSEETRDRIARHLHVSPDRIVVTPYGVSRPFLSPPVVEPARRGSYLLFAGTLEARKGLDVLETALDLLAREGRRPELVLAGAAGWGSEASVDRLLRRPGVRFEPGPSDERLATLYRGALALVHPSRMEGFGLPVAEAMAAGCPVVASDLACVREFALDAPLYSPPGDAPALAASLAQVLGDADLRSGMAERGVKASEPLRWERTAELSARAIESALGR